MAGGVLLRWLHAVGGEDFGESGVLGARLATLGVLEDALAALASLHAAVAEVTQKVNVATLERERSVP